MAPSLEVSLGEPTAGWIGLRIAAAGLVHEDSFSHIYPTLDRLCGALCEVASGVLPRPVVFLLEPAELELSFLRADGDRITLVVDRHPDHRRSSGARGSRVIDVTAPRSAVVLTFWRALRRLQTCLPPGDFERAWRHPFPDRAMASLTALIEVARSAGRV